MTYGETFKLDEDGDLSITSERIDLASDEDKVKQDLRILLQTVRGENILHRTLGLDILSESPHIFTERSLKGMVKDTLSQYHYEISISKIEVTLDKVSRLATIKVYAKLVSGVELEVQI